MRKRAGRPESLIYKAFRNVEWPIRRSLHGNDDPFFTELNPGFAESRMVRRRAAGYHEDTRR